MFTTLYKLLNSERIEIPIIQRDYAQGRENKVYLRERLLGSLINALKNNEVLSLDFVYGTKEHNAMWPLDGQQRLTTLWLLHWYLSVRTNKLDEARTWLEQFTYETRVSSREFCKSLCSLDTFAFNKSKMKIVEYIRIQTWFYSKYNQDPTILGMLRTLGGTNLRNSENEDIKDGIEEFLQKDDNCELYWKRLTSDDCPICFLYKDMKDDNLPLSDDLYIKMNARGKQLTDFENFKADLIGYAPDSDHPNCKLLDVTTASLIDNEWTDVFWEKATSRNVFKVDEVFFKFLRRFFLDRLMASTSRTVDEVINTPLYQDLYNGKTDYDGLKNYKEVLTAETFDQLKSLFSRWNDIEIHPHWDETAKFSFIPEYIIKETDKDGNPTLIEVSTISQKERAVFHAVVCYFDSNKDFQEDKFIEWLRFAWNIVENSGLETENAMVGAIRLFEELRPHCGAIVDYLASNGRIRSDYAKRQMDEERFKASLLVGSNAREWKPLIWEAENHPFFRGNISCLLRLDTKDFVDDIEIFKKKIKKAKQYFDNKGIKPEYALPLTKALIKSINQWNQLIGQYLYDTSTESWKQRILNNNEPGYYKEIHTLLTTKDLDTITYVNIENKKLEWTQSANKIKELFATTDFLEYNTYYGSIVKSGSVWRLCWAYGVLAFYPYRKYYAYNFDWIDHDTNYSFRRNELLHHPSIEIDQYNPECEGVYWNWRVFFDYNDHSYLWDNNNKVYLLNKQNNPKKRGSKHQNSKEDEFFCVHMNELLDITQQSFLIRLTNLAKEAEC